MRPQSSEYVPLVEFEVVSTQKGDEFLLKRMSSMMLLLPLDVCNRLRDGGDGDAERSISLLPGERLVFGVGLVDPFRGNAFEKLNGLR